MTIQLPDGTVEFRCYCPHVSQLMLVGDFNAWNTRCLPMIRDREGPWVYHLRLAPGTYAFRYYGDGRWLTDYAAFGLERGPFGWNSIVYIRPPSASLRLPASRTSPRSSHTTAA